MTITKLLSGLLFIFGLASIGYEASFLLSSGAVLPITVVALSCILGMLVFRPWQYVQALLFMVFIFLQGMLLPHYLYLPVRDVLLTPTLIAAIMLSMVLILLAMWQQPQWTHHQGKFGLVGLVLSLVGFLWLFPQGTLIAFGWGLLTAIVFGLLLFCKAVDLFRDEDSFPSYMNTARDISLQALTLFWVMIVLQVMIEDLG